MTPVSVREIRGEHIGKMVKLKGIITRAGDVKPLAVVSAYSCDACGNEVFQEVRQLKSLCFIYQQTFISNLLHFSRSLLNNGNLWKLVRLLSARRTLARHVFICKLAAVNFLNSKK